MKPIIIGAFVVFFVGCKRIALGEGPATVSEDEVSAGTNALTVAGYAWPLVIPFLRFIPVVGPVLQAVAANVSWSALATKQQKAADAGKP